MTKRAQKKLTKEIEDLLKYEPSQPITGAKRLAIWQAACGMLSPEKAQQMLDEVEKIRKEFDRELPEFH